MCSLRDSQGGPSQGRHRLPARRRPSPCFEAAPTTHPRCRNEGQGHPVEVSQVRHRLVAHRLQRSRSRLRGVHDPSFSRVL